MKSDGRMDRKDQAFFILEKAKVTDGFTHTNLRCCNWLGFSLGVLSSTMVFTRFDIDYYYPLRARAHDTTEITEKDIFYLLLVALSRCKSLFAADDVISLPGRHV